MANAKTIHIPPKPVKPEVFIELRLNADEAQALADLLMHVGGPPIDSRRGLLESIKCALYYEGVRGRSTLEIDDIEPGPGVYFKELKYDHHT